MLHWLSRRVVKDASVVVASWALVAVLALTVAATGLGLGPLTSRLVGGAGAPGLGESRQGREIIEALSGDGTTVTLLVTGVDVSTPERQEEVAAALADAHKDLAAVVGETNVLDPFVVPGMLEEPAGQVLASKDLDGFLIVVTVDPNGPEVAKEGDKEHAQDLAEAVTRVQSRLERVPTELSSVSPGASGTVSHKGLREQAVIDQAWQDTLVALLIALPAILLLLVLVFGAVLPALVPVATAVTTLLATLGALWLLSLLIELPAFVLPVTVMLALALATDYGFVLTTRFREELARLREGQTALSPVARGRAGRAERRRRRRASPVTRAVALTLLSTGRTILLTSLTMVVALAALLLIGTDVLGAIARAGIAAVVIATAVCLSLAPALVALVGRRLHHPSPLRRVGALRRLRSWVGDAAREQGVFSRAVGLIQRVPWVALAVSLVILVVLASPARHLHVLVSDEDLLPASSDQAVYLDTLAASYPAAQDADATVVLAQAGERATAFINSQVAHAEGVTSILRTATAGEYTVVYLDLEGEGASTGAEAAVRAVRDLAAPADMWVTGQAAAQVDLRDAITGALPWVVVVVGLVLIVLMLLTTASLVIPVKTLLVNTMSVLASYGVVTWVFQEGHLAGLLGVETLGGVEAYSVAAVIGIGLGLVTDDDLLLLDRVAAHHARSGDDAGAVEAGIQGTGRLTSTTAALLIVVFLSFVSSELLIVAQVALALAVLMAVDATVVRLLLLPAAMSLLGGWNWWLPRWLAPLVERYGLAEPLVSVPRSPTAREEGPEQVPGSVSAQD
ncbi:MMPL family transporter [Actinomyces sp. W5033]|uniref:MMPL family transporter n=1 Tax=Actinomyces sp. W5033 TaxID=3446479 RepID=UPI003EDEBF14